MEIWHRIQEINRDAYIMIFFTHSNWTIGARDNVHNICGQTSLDGTELWCNNSGRMLLNGVWLSWPADNGRSGFSRGGVGRHEAIRSSNLPAEWLPELRMGSASVSVPRRSGR